MNCSLRSAAHSESPSTADFLLHEVPPLIDLLALDYEAATLAVKDVPEVRVLIAAGVSSLA